MQLALLTALAWYVVPLCQAQGPVMEIEFEPMDGGPPDVIQDQPEFFSNLNRLANAAGAGPDVKREGELDQIMAQMMGGKLNGPREEHDGPNSKTSKWTSPDGSQEVVIQQIPMQQMPMSVRGAGGRGAGAARSRLPVDLFQDLFPGPLIMEQDNSGPMESAPFGSPDPLIMDMLQGMSQAFQQDMLPAVHRASGASRAPRSCHNDLSKHCNRERSQVHCLGAHQEDISEACRKDVGKSVPFVCSGAIDKFCDVLQTGILACLSEHLKDLDGPCSDAIIATRHVIDKANKQKVSVKVRTPEKTTQPPVHKAAKTLSLISAEGSAPPGRPAHDDSMKMLESTADIVAEATGVSKHSAAAVQHAVQQSAPSSSWRLLLVGLLVAALVYAWAFTDSSTRVYSAFKPYMHIDEDSKPLRGGVLEKPSRGVELPKPVGL